MDANSLIMGVLVFGFIAWIIIQQITTQRYTVRRLWTIPVILAVVTYVNLKPDVLNDQMDMLVIGVAGVIGCGLGLVRGMVNKVNVDYATGELIVRGSILGLAMWLVFIAGEICLRLALNGGSFSSGSAFNTVLPLALLTGIFSGWRFAWYLKYSQQVTVQQ